jgi:D-sedoheptulose 7-phosphate isomerase
MMDWDKYKRSLDDALNRFTYDPKIVDIIRESRYNGQTIFTCGNGGSAAIASHLTCDLSKGANKEWETSTLRYRSVCLADSNPHMTAISNDAGYERIFKEQLVNLARPSDILFAISSSGNSPNIITAVDYANKNGLITIGITGLNGGKLSEIAQYKGHVNTDIYETAEDVHQAFCHYLAQTLRDD